MAQKHASREMLVISRPDPSLRNVVNGIVAGPDVNFHDYKSVDIKNIEDMIG